jgi:nanoRNase/pAp phosphatase (c-di-AMP/oligoRNAs hydrolase)
MENQNSNNINQISEFLQNSKDVAIIPSKISGADAFSAGVGLYYMLLSMGKQVSLVYPGKIPEVCKDLIAPEDVTSDTSYRKLLISVNYSNTPASKVQYSTDEGILKLVISPISKNFDQSKVKAGIEGFDFDLAFILGAQSTKDLGNTYTNLREEFKRAKVINIDNTNMNLKYGSVNLVDPKADNLSILIFKLASNLGSVPDAKAAKALLVGMTYREPKGNK